MEDGSTSTERTPSELFRFGLGFLGFMMGAGGLVFEAPALGLMGALLLVLVVASFWA